jgi:hypothetical protein
MSPTDRLLVLSGSAVLVAGLLFGAASAGATLERPGEVALRRRARAEEEALFPPVPALADPPRAEQKVRVDPKTLQIVGLDLAPPPGHVVVAWDLLQSYEYQADLAGLPAAIRALDGQKVTLAGFLMATYEWDEIKEFSLVSSHWSCCFGMPPGMDGWVNVKLAADQPGLPNTSEPIKVSGTFRVGEVSESGMVVAIYSLEDANATLVGW